MAKIYLLRHAKTESNEGGRIMGQSDSPLSEKGLAAMQSMAASLQNLGISAIYTSDLPRAKNSAKICQDFLNVPLHETPALREIHYGDLAGLTKKEAQERYPLYKKDLNYVFPGGESFAQMQARALSFLSTLQGKHAKDDVLLLVTHAGVIRALRCAVKGLNFAKHLEDAVPHEELFELK